MHQKYSLNIRVFSLEKEERYACLKSVQEMQVTDKEREVHKMMLDTKSEQK